ncbi:Arylsulphatase [Annulohypoxylon maeteangense]|uniref:Arylsulphatase n=1 Tax=Annulohypoxylon maeteangense TaxID=1927788 RepID=UPI002008CE8B|nr:Arylsulphatase [Annulohypoxylon maeteangense]KAI0883263.1 Arylsulphatase [Annulohypoxylon maeteangense]
MHIAALVRTAATAIGFGAAVTASDPGQVPLGHSRGPQPQRRQPNVVFVLTDDQDVHLGSLDYMPLVKKHLLDQGTYFSSHYATTAVCCPSRVTIWTGKFAHNTNVTDVSPPYGGYPKFVAEGFNDNYFPVWLQQAGYNTYYTGKLFNVHTVENYNSPPPGGFTGSDFLLDPHTYDYLNSTFQRNGEEPRSYEGHYSTDVLAGKAYGLLDEAVEARKPFFLVAAPIAPHANVAMKLHSGPRDPDNLPFEFTEPIPADRHKHLFPNEKVPRTANFNPDQSSGANWITTLPQQNGTNVAYNDHFYRQRLRSLQAVDELVDGLISRLEDYGILEDTYIVYSSDNGYHIGQHRLQPGKSCGYETDVNVPLIVRGPGVARNYTAGGVVSTHADLAPTFFGWLGIEAREDFDGAAIPVTQEEIGGVRERGERREHAGIEYWGFAMGEGVYNRDPRENNTYKALRISGPGYNLYYSVWCNNEHELYDMKADPDQLHNLLSPSSSSSQSSTLAANHPVEKLASRLDALLLVLKTCTGKQCQHPWSSLHPDGTVKSLADALAPRYDAFYLNNREVASVKYAYCANGFIPEAEGPTWEDDGRAFGGYGYLKEGRWEDWV